MSFAITPEPPYYAVMFTSQLGTDADAAAYGRMAARMVELAEKQPGFLGIESVRSSDTGFGITVSYWRSEDDILAWKRNAEHKVAQAIGIQEWYKRYELRVARVDRAYSESTSPRSSL